MRRILLPKHSKSTARTPRLNCVISSGRTDAGLSDHVGEAENIFGIVCRIEEVIKELFVVDLVSD